MPERKTIRRAREKQREGKAPSTQASEFVREQVHRLEGGKGRPRSRRQAIAIGLSEAREAGVPIPSRPRKSSRSRKSSASEQRHTDARSGQKRTAQAGAGARKTSRTKRSTSERAPGKSARRAPARRASSAKAATKRRNTSARRGRSAPSA